eukprot:jgi/Galph1/510/GphlegSOOS_G5280.1
MFRLLHLRWGAAAFPHPDKVEQGKGEDAYFIEGMAAGVFDGVGGWESKGIDPSLFSTELANKTAQMVKNRGPCYIIESLEYAAEHTTAIGSSTATVVAYCEERNKLIGINVGDSGFLHIRKGSALFRTTEQQHFFNCPFQLGTNSSNQVLDGEFEREINVGDTLILGTDGLFDNMRTEEILQLVNEANGHVEPQKLAHQIAQTALEFSMDESKTSPFAENANEAGYIYIGGKRDDITVVVGRVMSTRD